VLSFGCVKLVLVLLLCAGCSAAVLERPDAAHDGAAYEAASDAESEAGVCGPVDVSAWLPSLMHQPNPAHANKCTAQQASDYAACEGGDTSKCTEFEMGQPAFICGECIQSQDTDPKWGVVVFNGPTGTLNTPGCVDDALGQTTDEDAIDGGGSCGDLLFDSYGCQEAACNACVGDSLVVCTNAALTGGCAPWNAKVENPMGMCDVLFGDAAPSDVTSCFPDETITDANAQRLDWITRMATYMCGP